MTRGARREDVEHFRALLAARLGLGFGEGRAEALAELLERRAGGAVARYLQRLAHDDDELAAIAPDLTVGETYFFRHAEQLRAFVEHAVPERARARGGAPLAILSAGCASGEEPYTLAMLLMSERPEHGATIRAVDVSRPALAKARRALYSAWALRETPPALRKSFFRPHGNENELDDAVRRMVTFEERNLGIDDPDLFADGAYDIVFCRNVLMYFTEDQARAAVARLTRSLARGGFLFLGHAETLRGLSQDFHLCHTHGAFYYQRRDPVESKRTTGDARNAAGALYSDPIDSLEGSESWVDAIRRASERVVSLSAQSASADGPFHTRRSHPPLAAALELLSRERFADALESMRELPSGAEDDPDVLLLRAALLAHSGALAAAEATCRSLLAVDELNAGAHYVLALVREASGDVGAAMEEDRVAAYLDPGFAMPRLHLGLAARRAGEREVARDALASAVVLLEREDASRILLFGGGFTRDSLIALCRAELAACGGSS